MLKLRSLLTFISVPSKHSNKLYRNKPLLSRITQKQILRLTSPRETINYAISSPKKKTFPKAVLATSILGWLGFIDEDEEKESELIMTLKRAVLCTQREQYDTAEKLLHVALRLAQQQQNLQGVMYCYDLMANLALERSQFEKAEPLFIDVLKMLLGTGLPQDDIKVIHISLKMAQIHHRKGDNENAKTGFLWCLDQMEPQKNKDVDHKTLYGVINDWYAQYLLDMGDKQGSMKHLKEAYDVCCDVRGKNEVQTMIFLNDLALTSWSAGDIQTAENWLKEAVSVGRSIEDQSFLGICLANLGVIELTKGFVDVARKFCKEAYILGTKYDNAPSKTQADYCFEQIRQAHNASQKSSS